MRVSRADDEEDSVPLTMGPDGKITSQRKAKETEESVYRRYLLTMEKLAAAEQLDCMGKAADATTIRAAVPPMFRGSTVEDLKNIIASFNTMKATLGSEAKFLELEKAISRDLRLSNAKACTARDFSDKLMLTLTTSLGSSARGGGKASTYLPPHKRGGGSHKKPPGLCNAFKEGNCVRGPQCKFRHG